MRALWIIQDFYTGLAGHEGASGGEEDEVNPSRKRHPYRGFAMPLTKNHRILPSLFRKCDRRDTF